MLEETINNLDKLIESGEHLKEKICESYKSKEIDIYETINQLTKQEDINKELRQRREQAYYLLGHINK